MAKLTLEEKRLQTLRRQLYGKEVIEPKNRPQISPSHSNSYSTSAQTVDQVNYLKTDLLKILLLSTFAFLAQAVLYFALTRQIINLKLPW